MLYSFSKSEKYISYYGKDALKKENIKSIEKALDLLELLSDNQREMGVTEIAQELNMGTSTVYRLLTTLKCRGYIIQDRQTSKYTLGAKLFILGSKVQNIATLIKIVTPFLKSLSQSIDETINFGILEDKEVICLYKIESKEMLRAGLEVGAKIPAHCTALGKILLAFLSESEIRMLYGDNEKLSTFTPNTISSLEELKESLKKIKKQGYAIDKEEFKKGVNCLGIPIINSKGKTIAAISIAGPASRFSLLEMEKTRNILLNLSLDISKQL